VPDVLAFFAEEPPIVLDWKVHFFASADAGRQLASDALALARAAPHKDFPFSADGFPETETQLLEVQLLKARFANIRTPKRNTRSSNNGFQSDRWR
jgi:hypothetical protein